MWLCVCYYTHYSTLGNLKNFLGRQAIEKKNYLPWKKPKLPSRNIELCWFNVATSFVTKVVFLDGHQQHHMFLLEMSWNCHHYQLKILQEAAANRSEKNCWTSESPGPSPPPLIPTPSPGAVEQLPRGRGSWKLPVSGFWAIGRSPSGGSYSWKTTKIIWSRRYWLVFSGHSHIIPSDSGHPRGN